MSRIKYRYLPLLAAAVSLAACFSDEKAPSGAVAKPQSVTVSPSLGLIRSAMVKVFQADGVTLLGEIMSGTNGVVDVSYLNHSGPVVIEIIGGSNASYFDESLQAFTALPSSARLRAMAVLPTADIAVTPLTNLAYEIAKTRNLAPLTAADVAAINEQVRASIAPGISNILAVPVLLDQVTANALGDTDAGRHALVLAALADLSSGNASPALNTLLAIANDGADGALDGMVGGSSITVPYTDFVADMAAALVRQANIFGNAALKATAADQAPESATIEVENTDGGTDGGNGGGSGTGDGTGGGGGTGSGTGDGTGGGTGDGSDGDGTGGGTNGGSDGGNSGGTGGDTDPAADNQGKGRFTGDGFTGDIDGVTHTYTETISVLANNSENTQVYIEGRDSSALNKWRVIIPRAVGTYHCDDSGNETVLQNIMGTNAGAGSNDGSCIIKVLQAGPIYEGYFTGQLYGRVGSPLRAVSNGYFYATADAGNPDDGGSGGSTDGGVSGDLNNAVYDSLNSRNGATINFVGSAESYNLGFGEIGRAYGLRGLNFYIDDTRDFNTTLVQDAYPTYLEIDISTPDLGEQDCSDDLKIRLQMKGGANSGNYAASACKIRLDYASDIGGLQGVILSATLNRESKPSFELVNTPFRIYHHVGNLGELSGELPLDKFGSIEIADGGTFELGANQHFLLDSRIGLGGTSPDDGTPAFTGNASDVISLNSSISLAADKTYTCSTGALSIKVGTYLLETVYSTAQTGGTCNITTVGRGGKFYDASYSATLKSTDGRLEESLRTLSVSGKFRNYAIRLNRPEGGVDDEGDFTAEESGLTLQIVDGSPDWQTGDRFKFLDDEFDQVYNFEKSYNFNMVRGERSIYHGIDIINIPRAVGVYDCANINTNESNRTLNIVLNAVGLKYETTVYNSAEKKVVTLPGAACQVEVISEDNGFVNGTYTATAIVVGGEQIMPGGDNTVRVSGRFRRKLEPTQP